MLKLGSIKSHFFTVALAFLLIGFALYAQTSLLRAETSGIATCNNGVQIITPVAGQVVSGEVPLLVQVPDFLSAYEVSLLDGGDYIGVASKTDPQTWQMVWDSRSITNDTVKLRAVVKWPATSSGTASTYSVCSTPERQIIVSNGSNQSAELRVTVDPASWSGPTNFNVPIRLTTKLKDNSGTTVIVTDQANYQWIVSGVGSIRPSTGIKNTAQFSSGPTPGSGKVKIAVSYGGMTEHVEVPIQVFVSTDTTGYPNGDDSTPTEDDTSSSGTGNSKTDATRESSDDDATEHEESPDAATSDDEKSSIAQFQDQQLESCLRTNLGDDYKETISGGQRLTYQQLEKVRACFAVRRFVLPANLAPVDPVKVPELSVSSDTKVLSIDQATNNLGEHTAIILRGTARANSDVVLYVYSEPLVLTTQSDENGNWTYVLEDPLEPGDHKVYVAVQQDDGNITRSQQFAFTVAQVASTEENPNGLSLSLASVNENRLFVFIFSSMAIILIALVMFLWVIHWRTRIHHHHAMKPEGHGISG